jgi:membrane-associated phospholipid phosphatase
MHWPCLSIEPMNEKVALIAFRSDFLRAQALLVVGLLLGLIVSGCATSGQRVWGADATLHPGAQRVREAAMEAARSPRVWVPLAGAALFQVNDWDRKVSNWARDKTPIFGSQQSASDWSDTLRTASSVAYFATVLATPGADTPHEWLLDKSQGLAVGLGAIAVTGVTTTALKKAAARTRPNGQGTESFPSGHTSHSSVVTGLARDNLRDIDMNEDMRRGLDLGLDMLTAGTAWARIEAGAHFPADTLVSIALGNFVSSFFDEAFLQRASDRRAAWTVTPLAGGLELYWQVRY